jgi:O-glycosyl hydrolase
VLCASAHAEVEATAFVNPDGSRVVVATNRHDHALHLALRVDESCWAVDLPERSIATFVADPAAS